MIDVITISTTATMHIHLYLLPSVQPPGWKLDPARQRRKIGIANATYKPDDADRDDREERDRHRARR